MEYLFEERKADSVKVCLNGLLHHVRQSYIGYLIDVLPKVFQRKNGGGHPADPLTVVSNVHRLFCSVPIVQGLDGVVTKVHGLILVHLQEDCELHEAILEHVLPTRAVGCKEIARLAIMRFNVLHKVPAHFTGTCGRHRRLP